jgi:uncharacterized protein (TIGR02145 family)
MKKTVQVCLHFSLLFIILASCQKEDPPIQIGSVTDTDGNTYKTVVIGSQTWMAENLKVTHFRNGDPIQYKPTNSEWSADIQGAYCWYGNDESTYKETYGALYNYRAVIDSRNICPEGWKIPTQADWNKLSSALGGDKKAGGKLKEPGFVHWYAPNVGATDAVKFAALPGGERNYDGVFEYIGQSAFFWTSSTAYFFLASFETDALITNPIEQKSGLSVRCIKIAE